MTQLPSNEITGPQIIVPKQNIILDATILSTVMSCPRLTDFRFGHHFVSVSGKSKSLEMGSTVHVILEYFNKNLINGFKRADCIEMGYLKGQEYIQSEEVKNLEQEDIDLVFKTMDEYFDFYKYDHWTPLEVETVKGKILYEDDEIRVLWKAKFDLISDTNQGIYPIDHKTMKQRRDTLTLNNQFMGQCILLDTRSMFVNKIGFQTSLKPNEKFTRAPIAYTANRLIEWQSTILPYYAKLMLMYQESEYWPPNFTHCENKYGFCAFKEVCESDQNMREEVIQNSFTVGTPWDIGNNEAES